MADPLDGGGPDHGHVDVIGADVPAGLGAPEQRRPRVVVVTDRWGASWTEAPTVTRLLAGAVAGSAQVSVVSIDDHTRASAPPRLRWDGVFDVHSTHGRPARPELAALLRASLRLHDQSPLGPTAQRGLLGLENRPTSDALVTAVGLAPDTVVLAGRETFWMGEALPVTSDRPRVVVMPLGGTDELMGSDAIRPLVATADGVIAVSVSEYARLAALMPADRQERLVLLRPAFPVNRAAAASGMAGMASFGRYLLVLSGFPEDDPSFGRCPPHDYLRQVLGQISVAEVRHGRWMVTDTGRRYDVVWAPNRMNVWKLMAGAALTLDLRPPGPVGRETVESLLLGTPVVVPADGVGAEHARLSNGGLWYRDPGEMIDTTRALLADEGLRSAMAGAGHEWAEREFGDMAGFVEAAAAAVLGTAG